MVCVDSCSDGPIAICRICQAVTACLFLFIGITCQFYAGLNTNDISLGNLCDTYSGSSEIMDQRAFDNLFDWVQTRTCQFNSACCGEQRNDECINYDRASSFFLRPTLGTGAGDRVDLLRYAGPFFWCKHVPAEVALDELTCAQKMQENPGSDPQPCKVWPGQEPAPGARGNWYLAPATLQGSAIYHINCNDKQKVYRDFLRAVYGQQWSDSEVDAAGSEFYSACIVDKGSDGFILIVGPIVALLGGVVSTLTMFTRFHRPPWPDVGINMLLIATILLLVGFWSISISTSGEIFNSYTWCGDADAPLVNKGRWYDQTPCIDRDSLGEGQWNPFVVTLLGIDSTYIAGGVLNVLATLMFLGLVSGFTEKMIGERFGKYLVDTRDFFVPRPNLPFPSRSSTGAQ
mmetsp:Transcript_66954/g.100961  ORF Transcript_66954/g.100961 Transcript_66954/m.100961 type:complete len:402 (+) Transcript_66954:112-1317(+)